MIPMSAHATAVAMAFLITAHGQASEDLSISPHGLLIDGPPASLRSPNGRLSGTAVAIEGDFTRLIWQVRVVDRDGTEHLLPRVVGNGLLLADVDRLVAIESYHSSRAPSRVTVLDLAGEVVHELRVPLLVDPSLSADGERLVFRSGDDTVTIDLLSGDRRTMPAVDLMVAGRDGAWVGLRDGEVIHRDANGSELSIPVDERPRRLAITGDGHAVLVLTAEALVRVELRSGQAKVLHRAAPGRDLRDLQVTRDGIVIGERERNGGTTTGRQWFLAAGATRPTLRATATSATPVAPYQPPADLPWPILPDSQHPIGNTYAEFQNYGGSSYLHPGVDVLGADNQPVFSVADGVVKAILTTSAQWHWRIAIALDGGSGTSEGYLYAHLTQSSIPVNVGETVTKGQYIGDLVPWPVSGFTHTHFARVEDSGAQWFGAWLCTDNPHVDFGGQTDVTQPLFEPAINNDAFAFCRDETSIYLDPSNLFGNVDIVARVSDTSASFWRCSVQTIKYTIHPVGAPQSPVVDDKLAVEFDMPLDTYFNGPIDPFLVGLLYKRDSTCFTEGDYSNREFYHVITNSNGDDVFDAADALESWDTSQVPDGDYVIVVTAVDANGNTATQSMTVTTNNGT